MVKKSRLAILLFLVALSGINLLSHFFYTRIDLTKEKRFTLQPASKQVLNNIKEPIDITVFLEGNIPAAFKRLRNATADLLNDYNGVSGRKIKVRFVDPIAGLAGAELDTALSNLYAAGIEPTSLNIKKDDGFAQKTIFPMALVESKERGLPVKLLQNFNASGSYEENINSSIENLEYVFYRAVDVFFITPGSIKILKQF